MMKRKRELAQRERKQAKAERRAQKKAEREAQQAGVNGLAPPAALDPDLDPDIAHIIPGPQPLVDEDEEETD